MKYEVTMCWLETQVKTEVEAESIKTAIRKVEYSAEKLGMRITGIKEVETKEIEKGGKTEVEKPKENEPCQKKQGM